MFQNEYKKAYDKIYADQSNLQELMMRAEEASSQPTLARRAPAEGDRVGD